MNDLVNRVETLRSCCFLAGAETGVGTHLTPSEVSISTLTLAVNCGGRTLSELYTTRGAKEIAKLSAMVP